jgi:cyclopropane fatty-acyl-phospholipid synthase-like methyltransferase
MDEDEQTARQYDQRYGGEGLHWTARPPATCFEVLRRMPPDRPRRLLDIGCGEGRNALFFARNGYRVDAFDLSARGVAKAQRLAAEAGLRLNAVRFYDFFPEAKAIDNARLPDLAETTAALQAAGLELVAHREVTQVFARSLRENCERIRLKGVSTFELLSEEQFQRGLSAMQASAEREDPPRPVTEMVDFLVFRKPQP